MEHRGGSPSDGLAAGQPASAASRTPGPAAPTPKGRPRDEAVDRRILLTAFAQLVRLGYGGLSIEAVAAEAGVAKTTVYRRYPTKRDLVIAAMGEETTIEPLPADLPARAMLERFVRLVIGVLIESGAARILGSLLVEDQREPGILDAFREQILGPRRAIILEVLRRGVANGEIRPDIDPLIVTEMVVGTVFGHHVILGLPATDAWVDSLVDHVLIAIAAE